MTIKKRFIAGAICPRCREIDKIVMYSNDGTDYRECVACDFSDKSHFKPHVKEMQTRVNTSPEELEEQTQVVKIFDAPPKKR